ncbi:site-specific integrase [Undibacterium sp. FT79W]|uniref:site-specific integrase n=1 Tax=Undibacterium sp. FT79W TaxID=2762296 RepID=UPI00164B702E|nr:site-specific integrase [Undibacterium sp. FT79W]MBC3876651.1 site-specific integrase [Undibacterium sp. FT79W]
MHSTKATVHVLPIFRLTQVQTLPGNEYLPVNHQINGTKVEYWREIKSLTPTKPLIFPKFPIVLNSDASPWAPAVLWLIDRAKSKPKKLSSLLPVAQGLRDYKVFLDDVGLVWDDFSEIEKLSRPTYLYLTYLQGLVDCGEIEFSTANRRMSTVLGLYRFAQQDHRLAFKPSNPPWVEKAIGLRYRDAQGFYQTKEVITTDLQIKGRSGEDELSDEIYDGGKLRPLPTNEQAVLIRALRTLGNTEFSLMHYLGLTSGAREMTVLTLRIGDFLKQPSTIQTWPFKLSCGPGTQIDTKFDRKKSLIIPQALYRMLHTYCVSDRAKKRRAKSRLGESPHNYVFLTRQGNPYYERKEERNSVRPGAPLRRTSPQGQALREFIKKRVIPEVQKTVPNFHYKFHDTRATFGMNWVDGVMGGDNADIKKYHWALDQLRKLMWHKSTKTTEKYLEYRRRIQHLNSALQGWSSHLVELMEFASIAEKNINDTDVDG